MNAYMVTIDLYNGDTYTEGAVAYTVAQATEAIMEYLNIKEHEVRRVEVERTA